MAPMRFVVAAMALLGSIQPGTSRAASDADGPLARGKYARRQEARGETTDLSAKVDAWAFMDDRRVDPLRLALYVDTWPARHPAVKGLLPLTVGLSYSGKGRDLPVRPDRFCLSWDAVPPAGSATVKPLRCGLTQRELLDRRDGLEALRHDRRLARQGRTVPFGEADGTSIAVAFYSDPAETLLRNDDTSLPAGSWFSDLLEFPVPEGFDPAVHRLRLDYRGEAPDGGAVVPELAGVAFRIAADPSAQQGAFSRARKARRHEDAAARRRGRPRRRRSAI